MLPFTLLLTLATLTAASRNLLESHSILSGSAADEALIQPAVELGLRSDLANINLLEISHNESVLLPANASTHENGSFSTATVDFEKSNVTHSPIVATVNSSIHQEVPFLNSSSDHPKDLDKVNVTHFASALEQKRAAHAEDEAHVLPHHNVSGADHHSDHLNESSALSNDRMKVETFVGGPDFALPGHNTSDIPLFTNLTPEEVHHIFHHHIHSTIHNKVDPQLDNHKNASNHPLLSNRFHSSHTIPDNDTLNEKALPVPSKAASSLLNASSIPALNTTILQTSNNATEAPSHVLVQVKKANISGLNQNQKTGSSPALNASTVQQSNHTEAPAHINQLKLDVEVHRLNESVHHNVSEQKNSSIAPEFAHQANWNHSNAQSVNQTSSVLLDSSVNQQAVTNSSKNESAPHQRKKVAWHEIMKAADEKERRAASNSSKPIIATPINQMVKSVLVPQRDQSLGGSKIFDLSSLPDQAITFANIEV